MKGLPSDLLMELFGTLYEPKPRTDMGEKCMEKSRIFLYFSKIISLIQFTEANILDNSVKE